MQPSTKHTTKTPTLPARRISEQRRALDISGAASRAFHLLRGSRATELTQARSGAGGSDARPNGKRQAESWTHHPLHERERGHFGAIRQGATPAGAPRRPGITASTNRTAAASSISSTTATATGNVRKPMLGSPASRRSRPEPSTIQNRHKLQDQCRAVTTARRWPRSKGNATPSAPGQQRPRSETARNTRTTKHAPSSPNRSPTGRRGNGSSPQRWLTSVSPRATATSAPHYLSRIA